MATKLFSPRLALPLKQSTLIAPLSISKRYISQSPIAMSPRISDAIKEDHREIEDYYNKILSATTEKEKTQWQNQFTWELARHSLGEELVVYPIFEKVLPDGRAMADNDRKQHNSVKEQLKKFQNMKPSDPDFEPTIKALMTELAQHIKEEEAEDLPKLEDAISAEESEKLTKSFGRTKIFVPSRSHPSAPDKPPFETAVGLMTAPLDHLADMFRTWPHTKGMPNPST
ncbi:hemerythrin HHE cation binding domain-containing protein, partial [Aspergillus karnatakaensis]|uniref:hemerythrin HHE cation binding domain-containing protein n=1 Tax=Aspergillus karnatakaensis TaxID=1810916 RepID=UPI003CCD1451